MADMFNIAINCNSLFNLAGLLIAAVTLIVYIRSICVAIYAGIKFLAKYEKVELQIDSDVSHITLRLSR